MVEADFFRMINLTPFLRSILGRLSIKIIGAVVRFVVVGAGAVLLHYVIALLLNKMGEIGYQESNAIGFFAGFFFSYVAHAWFTYGSRPNKRNFIQYACLGGVNLFISAFGIHLLKDLFLFEWIMLVVVVVLPIINFFMGRLIFVARDRV